ncbi:MAG: hypothetical protein PHO14_01530 [Kiritimatiellae bacterium]|nr:hypothetical protein [Kiritimatiellia bacterium]
MAIGEKNPVMIELKEQALAFSFPDIHPSAKVQITFQRTLRIPDDGKDYPLPPGLGNFPLVHVDDYAKHVPASWSEHGGVILPMYQSEALWINFRGHSDEERQVTYPFALQIATGKINAVSGHSWEPGLHRSPRQDSAVVPIQPWIDGYCVDKGVIRQFVAMPLGEGYTAEEQVSGKAEHGGIQIMAIPIKRNVFESKFPVKPRMQEAPRYCVHAMPRAMFVTECQGMGLAPGGRMKQEILEDKYDLEDWDLESKSRCFVHIANSQDWHRITGEKPPTTPPTAAEYNRQGLPWFDYYSDAKPVAGSELLGAMQSVEEMGKAKGSSPLPENQSFSPLNILNIFRKRPTNQVQEWEDSP